MQNSPRSCRSCLVSRPITDFYVKQTECKECSKRRVRMRRSSKRGDRTDYVWLRRKLWKLKDRAKKHNWDFDLDVEFVNWLYNTSHPCSYCKTKTLATFDRKDNAIGYTKANLVIACFDCNVLKSDRFTYDEMIEIGRTLRRVYKKRVAIKK